MDFQKLMENGDMLNFSRSKALIPTSMHAHEGEHIDVTSKILTDIS